MKVLICGDRNWKIEDSGIILREILDLPVDTEYIIGDCPTGADRIALELVKILNRRFKGPFVAHWDQYGNRAGPIRNAEMIKEKPDLVLAFHKDIEHSKGTKNCVNQAKRRGISVRVITE